MDHTTWNGKRAIKDPDLKRYNDPCENFISIEFEDEKIFCSFQSPRLITGVLKNLQQYRQYKTTNVEYIDYCPYKGEKRPVKVDIYLPLGVLTLKSKQRNNARTVVSRGSGETI